MKKMAGFFRVVGGLLLLADIFLLFVPIIKAVQENYPMFSYRQIDFIQDCFEKIVMRNSDLKISSSQIVEIIIFMILPVLLALIFGIISIVAGERQIISGCMAIVIAILNIMFTTKAVKLGMIYKKQFQTIEKQQGLNFMLILSVVLIIFGIMIVITKPSKVKKNKKEEKLIPNVQQIYQEQIKPKYEFIDEAKQENKETVIGAEEEQFVGQTQNSEKDSMIQTEENGLVESINSLNGQPRGVMVGISGIYAGAEIPFKDGEEIKFGRDIVNDVIFSDAVKVSRLHCAITWDGQKKEYYIVDNSSNGCFINERDECIPQNLPIKLEIGTILDIGDETNRFRLE